MAPATLIEFPSYGTRHADHRWPAAVRAERHQRSEGRHRGRHPGPLLLLPPRPGHRRVVPRLPREDREDAEAADVVLDAGGRGHGGAHAGSRGRRGPQGRVRVPADQSPARLPGVRQGRRVPAAGFLVHVRQRREPHGLPAPHVRRRGREGRRRLRPDADAEPQPLHPVHALQPLHGGSRRRRADRHDQPRQRQRDRDLQRAGRAFDPVGQPDGRVPGRRDHHASSIDSARGRGTTRTPSTRPARSARRAAAPPRGSRPSPSGPRARGWRASRRATTRRSTTSGCATSAASSICGSKASSGCASR